MSAQKKEYKSVAVRTKATPTHNGNGSHNQGVSVTKRQSPSAEEHPATTTTTPTNTQSARRVPPPPKGVIINVTNVDEYPDHPITSPRSVELLVKFGVHWVELQRRPLTKFQSPGVPPAIATMRCEHYEQRRQQKLKVLRAEYALLPPPVVEKKSPSKSKDHAETTSKRPTSATRRETAPSSTAATPRTVATPRSNSAPRPQRCGTPGSRTQMSGITTTSIAQSAAVGAMPDSRRRAVLEQNARRKSIYEKAQEMQQQRLLHIEQNLHTEESRSVHVLDSFKERQRVAIEKQKLRQEDHRDRVVQLQRIRDYTDQRRAEQWESKVRSRSVDRYNTLAARERYFTPSQRQEVRRSATPTRP